MKKTALGTFLQDHPNDAAAQVFIDRYQRLYYLDNLKVCLTVLVIMHHAGQAYGNGGAWPYTPSNPAESMPWIWHFFSTNAAFFMGLYFFISGYFVPRSFDK